MDYTWSAARTNFSCLSWDFRIISKRLLTGSLHFTLFKLAAYHDHQLTTSHKQGGIVKGV